ncbi:unnamed protein product [Microthlaspi erraticum]|uniref:Uncharacterized protein n=1 Tax=Microthlaspi erraticum TaxID=1685480 RepID=A0A6D2ITI2_9BRAS|nr:unnamed protein product [Microthlaspi erraticum]
MITEFCGSQGQIFDQNLPHVPCSQPRVAIDPGSNEPRLTHSSTCDQSIRPAERTGRAGRQRTTVDPDHHLTTKTITSRPTPTADHIPCTVDPISRSFRES